MALTMGRRHCCFGACVEYDPKALHDVQASNAVYPNVLASFGVYPNALAHVTKSTRPSLRLTPGQRSYVKIVRGERGPGNEATSLA